MQDQRGLACFGGLRGGDLAIFEHGVDDKIAALHGAVGMVDGRINRGSFGQSREQGGFVEREVPGRLAEVILRGSFKSVNAVAEKNLIRVKREDLRLSKAALDLDGEHGLLNFALPPAIGREKKIARELHSERGRALDLAARLDVAIGGSDDAPEIDAGVTIEILVFNGDQGVAQNGRKIVVGDNNAALQGDGADHPAVIVVEFGDRTGTVGFERIDLRKVGSVNEEHSSGGSDERRDKHEQAKEKAAYDAASADFNRWKIFVKRLHCGCGQNSTLSGRCSCGGENNSSQSSLRIREERKGTRAKD